MAMLFSKAKKKEANNVDLLLNQAEEGLHLDALLIENGQQLVSNIPDRVFAPETESSKECNRQARAFLLLLSDNRSQLKF